MEEDDLPPPAPPAALSDLDNEDEYDDDQFDKGSELDVHTGRRHTSCNTDNNNANANDETFDTLDGFGDDTMHALMDADLRLSAIPPLSTVKQQQVQQGGGFANGGIAEGFGGEYEVDADNEYSGYNNDDNNNVGGTNEFNQMMEDEYDHDQFENSEESEPEGEEEVSSLLRGPLMAAKSMMGNTNIGMFGKTPSKARAEFVMSAQKAARNNGENYYLEPMTPSAARDEFLHDDQSTTQRQFGGGATPSSARNEFLLSAQKVHPTTTSQRRLHDHSATPSTARNNLIISTQKLPRPPSSSSGTPSGTRTNFLISPQDSVSTIGGTSVGGSNSNTHDMLYQRNDGVRFVADPEAQTPSGERNKFMNSPQSVEVTSANSMRGRMTESVHGSGARSVASGSLVSRRSDGEPLSTVSRTFPAVQQVPSDEKIAKSVDTLIALGEKQMKMAASVGTNSINIVNNNPISTRSASLPPKRTFLRKGARKEPSALHNMNSATKPPTTTATTPPASSQTTSETSSERKARLARLEKMQEDLMKDLEKRQARKEEAQLERRRNKMKEIGSRGVVASATLNAITEQREGVVETPSQARSRSLGRAKTPVAQTPSQARARSVSRGRSADDANPTPFQVRSKSVKKRVDIRPSPVANGDDADMKNACVEGNELQTAKSTQQQTRARPVSRPRKGTPKGNTSLSPKRITQSQAEADKKAFDDWKKKEEEQWALIKNMRKRQEAALREAEGERERVSILDT